MTNGQQIRVAFLEKQLENARVELDNYVDMAERFSNQLAEVLIILQNQYPDVYAKIFGQPQVNETDNSNDRPQEIL